MFLGFHWMRVDMTSFWLPFFPPAFVLSKRHRFDTHNNCMLCRAQQPFRVSLQSCNELPYYKAPLLPQTHLYLYHYLDICAPGRHFFGAEAVGFYFLLTVHDRKTTGLDWRLLGQILL